MEPGDILRPILRGWTFPLLAFAIGYVLMGSPSFRNYPGSGCSLLEHNHFIVYSKRVVTPDGVFPAAVEVNEGKIVSVLKRRVLPKKADKGPHVMDYGNAVIMPGLVDVHAHLDEPGRTEWEGFLTGTRAAAAGGLTTLVDMPLNSFPATTSRELLELKKSASRGKLSVDVGFWGGLVPENAHNETILDGLLGAGALGLKSFMCPSGIDDFPMTTISHIKAALPVLAKYNRPMFVHAEVALPLVDTPGLANKVEVDASKEYTVYLNSRPPSWEQEAVRQLVQAAEEIAQGGSCEGTRIHIAHISDAGESLRILKEAKRKGLDISVETCPHYLAFAAEEIEDGQTLFKCSPPIRNAENRDLLWAGIMDGSIDLLGSDHSPSIPEMKNLESGDFLGAWGGISGLQFVLPVTWTTGRARGMTLEDLSNLWSREPAKLANLEMKGSIQFGKDADFVVWDPDSSFVLDENYTIHHKHKITPYAGLSLSGTVISTFVRGQLVFNESQFADKPCGINLLAR